MRPQTALSPEAPVMQALARGVCPICTLLRAFQNAMIDAPHGHPADSLCNSHAWSLAGSSPAVEAVPILRSMLEAAAVRPATDVIELRPCGWCEALREHEEERLTEFRCEMKRVMFADWMRQYGTICLLHARRLIETLPGPGAEVIRQIVTNNQEELERQLAAFEVRVQAGERGGGGVLGHIAEFLVSQGGVTR